MVTMDFRILMNTWIAAICPPQTCMGMSSCEQMLSYALGEFLGFTVAES